MNQGVWIDSDENTPTHRYEQSLGSYIYSWYLGQSDSCMHQPNYHHTLTII